MRKNAEEYGVRGVVEAAPSLHVNGEQSSVTVGSCQNAPPPLLHPSRPATRENSTDIIFLVTSFYFLTLFVFTLSLISSFFLC
jgi:hypothetical protein